MGPASIRTMRRLRSLMANLYRSALRPLGRVGRDIVGLVPALIAGAGVFLIVAGLFYYLQPSTAGATESPTPSPPTLSLASFPAGLSMAPSASGSGGPTAVATRIR